jgi:hypothetical protein
MANGMSPDAWIASIRAVVAALGWAAAIECDSDGVPALAARTYGGLTMPS